MSRRAVRASTRLGACRAHRLPAARAAEPRGPVGSAASAAAKARAGG